jgi:hypothetical protein
MIIPKNGISGNFPSHDHWGRDLPKCDFHRHQGVEGSVGKSIRAIKHLCGFELCFRLVFVSRNCHFLMIRRDFTRPI